MIIHYL